MCEEERIFSKIFNMFVWTSGFQKSLAHTDFNMFVDEWTSANESPESLTVIHFPWYVNFASNVQFECECEVKFNDWTD